MTEQVGWCSGTRFETSVGGDSSSHDTTTIGIESLLFDSQLSHLFALLQLPIFRLGFGMATTLFSTRLLHILGRRSTCRIFCQPAATSWLFNQLSGDICFAIAIGLYPEGLGTFLLLMVCLKKHSSAMTDLYVY